MARSELAELSRNRLGERLAIFISHTWGRPDLYRDAVDLVDETYRDVGWVNVSIPEVRSRAVSNSGREAIYQELDLQRIRLSQLDDALLVLEKAKDDISTRLEWSHPENWQLRAQEKHAVERAKAEASIFSAYMTNVVDKGAKEFEAHFYNSYVRHIDRYELSRRLNNANEEVRRLSREREHCSNRIQKLAILLSDGTSWFSDWKSSIYDKDIAELAGVDRNIALLLSNAIGASDVVLFICASLDYHRRWIDCELKVALNIGRPIIGIVPKEESFPDGLRSAVTVHVKWDSAALAGAIKELSSDSRKAAL